MSGVESVKSGLQTISHITRTSLLLSSSPSSNSPADSPNKPGLDISGSRVPELQESKTPSSHVSTGLSPSPHGGRGIFCARSGALMRATSAPTGVMRQHAAGFIKKRTQKEAISGEDPAKGSAPAGARTPELEANPGVISIAAGFRMVTETARGTFQVEVAPGGGPLAPGGGSLAAGERGISRGVSEGGRLAGMRSPLLEEERETLIESTSTETGGKFIATQAGSEGGGRTQGGNPEELELRSAGAVPKRISEEDMRKALSVLGAS